MQLLENYQLPNNRIIFKYSIDEYKMLHFSNNAFMLSTILPANTDPNTDVFVEPRAGLIWPYFNMKFRVLLADDGQRLHIERVTSFNPLDIEFLMPQYGLEYSEGLVILVSPYEIALLSNQGGAPILVVCAGEGLTGMSPAGGYFFPRDVTAAAVWAERAFADTTSVIVNPNEGPSAGQGQSGVGYAGGYFATPTNGVNVALAYNSFVRIGNKQYSFGGFNGTNYTTQILVADIVNDYLASSWTKIGDLDAIFARGTATLIGSNIYFLGGTDGLTSSNKAFRLNVIDDNIDLSKVALTALPKKLRGHATYSNGIYVWVFGGIDENDTVSADIFRAQLIGSDLGAWTKVGELPKALTDGKVIATAKYIYYIGGATNNSNAATNTVYYASFINSIIGQFAIAPHLPDNLCGFTVAQYAGMVYLFGGYNGTNSVASVYRALVNDGTVANFTLERYMPDAKAFAEICLTNKKVYICGGYNESDQITSTIIEAPIFDGILSKASATMFQDLIISRFYLPINNFNNLQVRTLDPESLRYSHQINRLTKLMASGKDNAIIRGLTVDTFYDKNVDPTCVRFVIQDGLAVVDNVMIEFEEYMYIEKPIAFFNSTTDIFTVAVKYNYVEGYPVNIAKIDVLPLKHLNPVEYPLPLLFFQVTKLSGSVISDKDIVIIREISKDDSQNPYNKDIKVEHGSDAGDVHVNPIPGLTDHIADKDQNLQHVLETIGKKINDNHEENIRDDAKLQADINTRVKIADISNNLTTDRSDQVLSAAMGKKLMDDKVDWIPKVSNALDIGNPTMIYRTVYANVFSGTAVTARYADLAEKYVLDDNYSTGTVLAVSKESWVDCTIARSETDPIIGVVADQPAFVMNNDSLGVPVTLLGLTPVKVVGPVRKGDLLIPSNSEPGYAQALDPSAKGEYRYYIIGVANDTFPKDEKGLVEAFVNIR